MTEDNGQVANILRTGVALTAKYCNRPTGMSEMLTQEGTDQAANNLLLLFKYCKYLDIDFAISSLQCTGSAECVISFRY